MATEAHNAAQFYGTARGGVACRLLRERLVESGAIPARTVAFFSQHAVSELRELSEPALSISRFVLDDLLAKEFRRLGGELREKERWRGVEFSDGIMRASGRRVQPVAPRVAAATAKQMRNGDAESGRLHLESIKRTLDREEPAYRS